MPPQHGRDRMRTIEERRHDAEIAAAAAQPPEQVRVRLVICRDDRALCGDDLAGEEVVAGQPVLAHQPSDAAAERQACDARARDDARWHRQSIDMRLAIDVAKRGARLHQRGSPMPIDEHSLHAG
jgi:hypothetical protein